MHLAPNRRTLGTEDAPPTEEACIRNALRLLRLSPAGLRMLWALEDVSDTAAFDKASRERQARVSRRTWTGNPPVRC